MHETVCNLLLFEFIPPPSLNAAFVVHCIILYLQFEIFILLIVLYPINTTIQGGPFIIDVARYLPAMVMILQNATEVIFDDDEHCPRDKHRRRSEVTQVHQSLVRIETVLAFVLYDFRLQNSVAIMPDNLGWWVLPRSITWFSQFVVYEFDDTRWIQNFRMPKGVVLCFASILNPHIEKKETSYPRAVPVLVRVCCTLYKLVQGAS